MANGLPILSSPILSGIQTVQQDVIGLQNLLFPTPAPVYGIFDQNGDEVLAGYESVIGFGFQADENVCTYPVEQGGFASYNKVALPFGAKLRYVVNGQPDNADFIGQLETIRQDTNLYIVITPEFSWQNVNVTHYDTRRDAQHGYSLVAYEVWLGEIRQATGAQFTQPGQQSGTQPSATATGAPDGQAQQSGGNVQAGPGALAGAGNEASIYASIAGESVTPPPVGAVQQ